MSSKVIKHLTKTNITNIFLVFTLVAEIITAIVVSIMSVLFHGRITIDFLITGVITAFIATLGIVSVTFYLLKELSESEERFRKIIETSTDWIWAIDENAVYTYSSPSIHDVLGYKPEEVLGKRLFDFMTADEANRVADIFGPIVLARKPIPLLENTNIHKNGHTVVLETKGVPVFDGAGRFCGYLGIDRDITERKKAEEQLELLSAAVAEAPDGIQIADLSGKIIYSNKSIQKIYGYSPDDYYGKHVNEMNADPEFAKKNILPSIIETGRWAGELEVKHKDGSIFPIWLTTSLISNSSKEPLAMIGIIRDISEHKKVEEELQKHRKQLEVLVEQRTAEVVEAKHLASLGELAAGVAHEINNPINGIINYGQLLVKKLANNSPEKDIAGRIMKEGDRIATIVRSLLSFGNAKRDEKNNIHLSEILEETLTLTAAQIRKDGIHLKTDIGENLSMVVGNLQRLQQVFLNVISNARYALNGKYPGFHSDKILEIKCEGVTIEDVNYVRISFLDHGTGIPADILDKTMNPFFSTKPTGHGTGLGLSISNSIIKDHGGRLELESKEGESTRVIIDLPVRI